MKKNSKPIIVVMIALTIIASIIIIYLKLNKSENKTATMNNTKAKQKEPPSQFSASFTIYTNGTLRTFTDTMYHELSPDAFITADNPNIILVKKPGISWQEFFNTLPFTLNENCLTTGTSQTFCTNESQTLQFYLNGLRQNNVLNTPINPDDKLLITYDEIDSPEIPIQIQSISEPN